jgi:hypothetical protein
MEHAKGNTQQMHHAKNAMWPFVSVVSCPEEGVAMEEEEMLTVLTMTYTRRKVAMGQKAAVLAIIRLSLNSSKIRRGWRWMAHAKGNTQQMHHARNAMWSFVSVVSCPKPEEGGAVEEEEMLTVLMMTYKRRKVLMGKRAAAMAGIPPFILAVTRVVVDVDVRMAFV